LLNSALFIFAAALAGLMIGSFLNVCIYRIPRGISIVAPRSFCPECGTRIGWFHNIPVASYLFLGGRCRRCRQPISLQYPLVECMTALSFALTVAQYGSTLFALKWLFFEAVLIVLFWTDLQERILPDECTLGGAAVGLTMAAFIPLPPGLAELIIPAAPAACRSLLNALLGALLLAAPIWLAALIYSRLRHREGLGFGDVKLLVLLGVFLGFGSGLIALMLGAVSGSIVGISYILIARKRAATYELPFGTFLCAAAVLVVLCLRKGFGAYY
jgi:leader peptidase (prepilin peptidase)/N-methyltransferase